jgi:hypothetical protein
MRRHTGRKLDPTALYAAVMTIACLLVSTYPTKARSGMRVVSADESTCGAVNATVALDSVTVATRAAVLGPAPAEGSGGR